VLSKTKSKQQLEYGNAVSPTRGVDHEKVKGGGLALIALGGVCGVASANHTCLSARVCQIADRNGFVDCVDTFCLRRALPSCIPTDRIRCSSSGYL